MTPCSKKCYSTNVAAALALRAMVAAGSRNEVGIHPCSRCHGFHLTSDKKSARNKWTVSALSKLGPLPGATTRASRNDRITPRG
jgi:hypothetical protein